MMGMLRHLFYAYLVGILALTVNLIHAQSQSGFISIDCGTSENSSYIDQSTGLSYVSDSSFTDTGISNKISLEYNTDTIEQQFWNARSFPSGDKNCYTLKPLEGRGNKYLIRARFMYGNYDGKDTVPAFDLYLGANKWGLVKLENESSVTTMEIIHIPPSDYVFVCLVNSGHGTPFISVLELRPLKNSTYTPARAAILYRRLDIGSRINEPIRYKDDVYDRIWQPFNFAGRQVLNTSLTVDANAKNTYQPPSSVMSTAMAPENATSTTFSFYMMPESPTAEYYVYMHFAELEKLEANQSREFNVYENGEFWYGPLSPDYLLTTTLLSTKPVSGDRIDYDLIQTETSTLQPILNALEVYIVQNFSESQTDDQDVDAMMNIKSKYEVKKNWQGDPCAPKIYMWEGLNCSFNDQEPARIISLNLSSSGLTGKIPSYISDLTMIQLLDLSNNSLTGSVPNFLSELKFLKVLILKGNNLSGSVPTDLIEKSNSGSLLLSTGENPDLCSSFSCQKKKKQNFIVPVIASVATLLALSIALVIGWRLIKRRQKVAAGDANKPKSTNKIASALEQTNHQFTYSEIVTITNNFEKIIGRGGFGTVYHGYLNDTQVAVKMLSETSAQGYKEFQAEVKLLMRVHHKNLTSLVGYCNEDNHLGLIYEYMANGNLGRHLSEKSAYTLSWEDRLRIAVDAAQGLEYLHHGCKPPIVHRDVKTTNILLNEKFQSKLADFGLSRAFPVEGGSHVSTVVAGTPGYLDPEYFSSNWLNEKSDVYSFGVALLEIITSRPVLVKSNIEKPHISQWVKFMLGKGEIKNIVDPRLQGEFQISSAWKAVEIAMACVHHSSLERPIMNLVVLELNECLALEIASKKDGRKTNGPSVEKMTVNLDTALNPLPR